MKSVILFVTFFILTNFSSLAFADEAKVNPTDVYHNEAIEIFAQTNIPLKLDDLMSDNEQAKKWHVVRWQLQESLDITNSLENEFVPSFGMISSANSLEFKKIVNMANFTHLFVKFIFYNKPEKAFGLFTYYPKAEKDQIIEVSDNHVDFIRPWMSDEDGNFQMHQTKTRCKLIDDSKSVLLCIDLDDQDHPHGKANFYKKRVYEMWSEELIPII